MLPNTEVSQNAKTYSGTRHLALSLLGRDLTDTWMVMVSGLTAYFDVSGHYSNEARAFACAGFGAPVENWTEGFEPRWREELQKLGLDELHMTDMWLAVQEGTLSKIEYARLMLALHDLLKKYAAKSFARVIDGEDLNKILASGDHPIRVAGIEIMDAVENWRENRKKQGKKTGPKERFKVVFDDGEAHFGTLVDAMPSGRKPVSDNSLDVLPLQAADWLAWELSRLHWEHKRHAGHGGMMPVMVRGEVWHAIHHLPRDWKYLRDGKWINILMPPKEAKAQVRQLLSGGG